MWRMRGRLCVWSSHLCSSKERSIGGSQGKKHVTMFLHLCTRVQCHNSISRINAGTTEATATATAMGSHTHATTHTPAQADSQLQLSAAAAFPWLQLMNTHVNTQTQTAHATRMQT